MRAYEASSFIEATAENVWPLLTDIAAWPDWDSGVTKVEGRLALGERLSITVKANPGRAFPVKVVQLTAPERMVFVGGMPFSLFVGRRTYTLASEGTGTRFTMREEYTGPFAGMIFKSIPDLGPSFRQFAEGLKRRAE
ncbi:SRPBCC domain-containing protein [Streptosporangiaceae bacterium NEAU-GS5]|nr:SRPBCC domain-containing protein [Streptosporangiaceae bacterium NEAU-GS5]